MAGTALIWDLLAHDKASPAFLKVAGAADKAAASTERATKGMAASTAKMGAVGASLTKKVTLPLAAIGAVSVAQAAKYQKAMTTIQVVTDQTAGAMQKTSKGLMNIAKDTGTSLEQLTDGLYMVEKGGLRGQKALDTLKAASQGAKAENVDLATATGALTSVMASYGKALGDPVKAENEIIKGSGLAKTTMQDFASSLSNVVPTAAALHISFSDVAAAIATMTQHGETAQHATDNLRNLITNLAGQNNVASQAMQQLGINTVDLSKNLGKRGLVGSLDYVLDRVARFNKGGAIVVDTFKHAAIATGSLHKMLDTMNGSLKTNSEGLLKGTVGIKDYTNFAKSMGGQAGASALQFLALYKSSLGFSNLIKSGKGNVQSYATALQKMLGGVTGMNVALQLSGESADRFHTYAKEIGDAATKTKGDVLGWANTQNTLSVKVDKAKASLQVMAVELGTALIPAVSKLADEGAKAAHWFDGLSGTQKKVLLWTAGVLLALGPILTLGSRLAVVGSGISKFAQNAGTRIASFAGASETTAARVGVAMKNISRAFSGLTVGAIAGQVGGSSSGGVLASVLLGTAGGWALGGPVGAAVGGVSAAIFKGVGLWNKHKDAAQQAAQQEKVIVDALTQSIQADNGALGANLRLSITKALQDKGILDQAQKLGVSLAAVVDAAMGKKGALQAAIIGPEGALERQLQQKQAYLQAHPNITPEQAAPIQNQIQSLYKQIQAYDALRKSLGLTAGDVAKAKSQFDQAAHAMNDNRVAAGSFTAQLDELRKHTSTALDANGQFTASLSKAQVVGQHNRTTLTDLAAAALADANNTFAAAEKHHSYAQALDIAKTKLDANVSALEKAATKAGFNKTQVDALIKSLHLYSGLRPSTTLRLNTGPAKQDLRQFIASLPTITLTARMKVAGGPGSSTYNSQVPEKARVHPATGGYITGPGTGTSDSIPAMLSNGEYVINARQTAKHRPLLEAINSGRGYANGGHVGNGTTLGGVHYKTKSEFQSALQAVNQSLAGFLAAAHNMLSTASDLASAAKDLRASAREQKTSAAFQQRLARESTRLVNLGRQRDRVRNQLGTAPTAPTAYDRLASAKQAYSDARSSTASAVSAFDITTAGVNTQVYSDQPAAPVSATSILGSIQAAAAKASKFASLLKKLGKEGLNKTLLMQLAQAGPTAYDQAAALAAATPAQIKAINSAESQLTTAGNTAGKYVADKFYKAGVDSAQGIVNGLLSKESKLNKAIKHLGDQMVSQLKHTLQIKSPSKVMQKLGQFTGDGYVLGVRSRVAHVNRASKELGNAATAGSKFAAIRRAGHSDGGCIHVHGIEDPVTFARRVETEQARRALARV